MFISLICFIKIDVIAKYASPAPTVSTALKENNLEIINNSSEEILNAMIEMDKKCEDEIDFYNKNKKMQNNFWNTFGNKEPDKAEFLRNSLKILISTNFLEKNQELL